MLGVNINTEEREFQINYKGTTFPVVDWKDLDKHRDLIENHIVLLGSTREEADKHYTPLGQLPGMEILAYALLSVLEGSHVSTAPLWQVILLALLAGYLTNVIDFLVSNAIYRRKSTIMVFITQSEFYDKLISFLVMVLLTFFTFMLFVKMDYFINSVLGLSTIVLIEEGRLLYVGILAVLKKRFGAKIVEKSIYAEELKDV
jgi:CHASE2 domain-containing sensor protein